jgi:hypothetical protein
MSLEILGLLQYAEANCGLFCGRFTFSPAAILVGCTYLGAVSLRCQRILPHFHMSFMSEVSIAGENLATIVVTNHIRV